MVDFLIRTVEFLAPTVEKNWCIQLHLSSLLINFQKLNRMEQIFEGSKKNPLLIKKTVVAKFYQQNLKISSTIKFKELNSKTLFFGTITGGNTTSTINCTSIISDI